MKRRTFVLVIQVLLAGVVAGCGSSSVAAHPSPSPSPGLSAADQALLAQLEQRPLHLPTPLKPGVCRPDENDPKTGLWGKDPVYVVGGPHISTSFGDYFYVSAITRPGMAGPVLLRARDLIAANHPVVYVQTADASNDIFFAGAVYGTDPTFGKQYTELVIDTSHIASATYQVGTTSYQESFWEQGIGRGWTGCVGFQIDSPGFSEDINVSVTP